MSATEPLQTRLQVEIVPDYDALSARAAEIVVETLRTQPEAVLSLTTGRTVSGLYRALCAFHNAGAINLAITRLVSSEEYVGVSDEDAITLFGWLRRDLLDPCGVPTAQVLRLHGQAPNLIEECRRFDAALAAWGGADLVVQSAGINGHFGFNEPGATPHMQSRTVELADATLKSNSAYWPDGARIPPIGLTMGVAQVLHARHVLLLAHGEQKAAALARALLGPIDSRVPCSLLRLAPRVTVIADTTAARDIASQWPADQWGSVLCSSAHIGMVVRAGVRTDCGDDNTIE
jgi:glucosamine-6-phosphate deaminase